jgi:hypothetical protein
LEIPIFFKNDWGVIHVVMSDYINFNKSKTVITAAITIKQKSKVINKTPDECNKKELIDEVFRQLKNSFGGKLPNPTKIILSPGIFWNNGKWDTIDSAYVRTKESFKMPFQSKLFNNLYTVGTHNEQHYYNFTSFESAVSNGVALCHKLIPRTRLDFPLKKPLLSIENLVKSLLFLILVGFLYIKKMI